VAHGARIVETDHSALPYVGARDPEAIGITVIRTTLMAA
jgi:hypothetical protein